METSTKIQKWGNSLAVRLPSAAAKRLNLGVGSGVKIVPGDKVNELKLVVEEKNKVTLKDLVDAIDANNKHLVLDWGKAGQEIW